MSRTINSIEINNLSYTKLRTLIHKHPAQHFKEVQFGNFQLELDLVDEVYDYSEQVGYCRSYIVHVDGNYAGYMVVMATEMLHHRGTTQALTDSFYIAPEYRSSGAFTSLLSYVEDDLRINGIRFLTLGLSSNTPHVDKIKQFVHNKGYLCTEVLFTKELT